MQRVFLPAAGSTLIRLAPIAAMICVQCDSITIAVKSTIRISASGPFCAGFSSLIGIPKRLWLTNYDNQFLVNGLDLVVVTQKRILWSPITMKCRNWGEQVAELCFGEHGEWNFTSKIVRSQRLLDAHAMGVQAVDTVFVDFRDPEGLASSCRA